MGRQVLRLALQALSQAGNASRYDVLVQAPHWAKYPAVLPRQRPWPRCAILGLTPPLGRRYVRPPRRFQLINTTTPWRRNPDGSLVELNWNPRADPDAPTTLEILTRPSMHTRLPFASEVPSVRGTGC